VSGGWGEGDVSLFPEQSLEFPLQERWGEPPPLFIHTHTVFCTIAHCAIFIQYFMIIVFTQLSVLHQFSDQIHAVV
jgi:hypothetical protein